jgi:hypothetical protein
MSKECIKCKEVKKLDDFPINPKHKDRYLNRCILCVKEYAKNYRLENPDSQRKADHKFRTNNPDKIKASQKKWAAKNEDYSKEYYENNKKQKLKKGKEWYENNKERKQFTNKEWVKNNKESINTRRNNWTKNRRKVDFLFRLKENIKSSIRQSITERKFRKSSNTTQILGCSFEELKIHLESKFEPWMNYDNYGLYHIDLLQYGWDIDHIIPLSSAICEEDVLKLNHYTNLQPLCSKVNRDIKKNQLDYVKINNA